MTDLLYYFPAVRRDTLRQGLSAGQRIFPTRDFSVPGKITRRKILAMPHSTFTFGA